VRGAGAALMAPAALSTLATTFRDGADRNTALGAWGAISGLAAATGVFLGGVLAEGPGWRWVLFVNPPVCLLVLAGAFWLLPGAQPSGEAAAWRDPGLSLAGDRGNVLEVGVVVQSNGTMVLGDSRGHQVNDACRPVVPASGHPDLDIPGPFGNYLGHREDDVEASAPLSDKTDVGEVAPGVASLQVDGDASGGGAVRDQSCYDLAHRGMPNPCLSGSVNQVELTRTSRQDHRRACRMTSSSAMSGPTPRANGSSSSWSMRRRLLATNSSAAFTVSFFVVVPSSLAARSSASSFKSIIVFIYTRILSCIHL
jgi:Major Facilitator Superfamily